MIESRALLRILPFFLLIASGCRSVEILDKPPVPKQEVAAPTPPPPPAPKKVSLENCMDEAVQSEAGQLMPAVMAIVITGPPNWEAQLDALLQVHKSGLICAVRYVPQYIQKLQLTEEMRDEATNRSVGYLLHHM